MNEGPSTNWRERIASDEDARFARQAEALAPVHAALSARYGAGRLLHRKPVLAARGTFEALADLPDYARHKVSPSRASSQRWRGCPMRRRACRRTPSRTFAALR